jgi:hypothetical protein
MAGAKRNGAEELAMACGVRYTDTIAMDRKLFDEMPTAF